MLADADLSAVATLMSGQRASVLLQLLAGRPLAASDLAAGAGMSASLASTHLAKLLDGGLVRVTQRGRRHEYRLASPQVAEVIEAMLKLAPHRPATTLRQSHRGRTLRHARTCYDHLAGELGVGLTDALQHQHLLQCTDGAYTLTEAGHTRLRDLGIDIDALRGHRRAFARPCLDWTEQRSHLAGALGAGIAARMLELDWVRRAPGSRSLHVTPAGRHALLEHFALNLPLRQTQGQRGGADELP
ncbi:MAG: ArsR/SmtB family transcription factor [Acidimicrobiales bacterium]